ncbi:unnamed protein product [Spirodela intermedia]|uniref:TsaA-like domain-containing protein n=1 Tax=Spirodela intermedia TaxID=51605 RepID=A0A7I8JJE5_SPIIN|nr:unnamed protein product [Spirodela intermedia]CAA6670288.1 unnamed protein product [Spirodela intermedia]
MVGIQQSFSVMKWTVSKSAAPRRRRCRALAERVRELEAQLKASVEKGAAERCGRIRAQQVLLRTLLLGSAKGVGPRAGDFTFIVVVVIFFGFLPDDPMATVRSCFSTRNGTPRQPLLVPLARACLTLDTSRVPPGALEGLAEYSHCWILYVFHLNTDLEKLWKHPSRSGFKAKVRVPRLKGGKMGVLATRSPHRPCPIGLTVAKVEGVDGRAVLLSGVDLVDGTPVLDIKPYLPYSDCVRGARTPTWLQVFFLRFFHSLDVASVQFSEGFSSLLAKCWEAAGKWSLYASDDELKDLIRQVLSWDIRSMSQRNRPHDATSADKSGASDVQSDMGNESDEGSRESARASSLLPDEVTYHLIVEGVDITYRIDENSNIMVEGASLSNIKNNSRHSGSNATWRNKFS